jgi:hypothetical protein
MMRMIDGGKPSAKYKREIHPLTLDFIATSIADTTAVVFCNTQSNDWRETITRPERLFFSVDGNMQQVSNVPLTG